jgi:hypothetical protein
MLAQNSTFNPYSRYGLGELSQTTFAHNTGMGGAGIALKPDSTMPIFVNMANPASYALIKLTALEVGGSFVNSHFYARGGPSVQKSSVNFSYGTLGFPVGRNGGAAFGIMPYSFVGYDTKSNSEVTGIGNVSYLYSGAGGLNKAFLGYGLMPFDKRLIRFHRKHRNIPDSLKRLSHFQYKSREFFSKMLSDFSVGFNGHYLFGAIQNTTRVVYPNSLLYNNTYRERTLSMGNFTGNFGAQTALTFDSVMVHNRKFRHLLEHLSDSVRNSNSLSPEEKERSLLALQRRYGSHRQALKEKVKITMGFFMGLNSNLKVEYTNGAYNYILNGSGQEIIRDTAYYKINSSGNIRLPLEQGFGLGFKKGEKLNIVADFAITNWQQYKFLNDVNNFKTSYRAAAGFNFVPEKYASGRGSFPRRMHYRAGFSYQTGYLNINNTMVSDWYVSAGLGFPVGIGRLSSMVSTSLQYGQIGTTANNLSRQNYWRINFGFTFNDRWFQKFKYD